MGVFSDEKYPAETLSGQVAVRTRNVVPNLKAQRQELQARIDKIDKLLLLLEKNPDFVQVIDLSRELM